MKLVCSFLLGFYMLAMGTTLVVCSSIYLRNLYQIDALHYEAQCSNGTFLNFQSTETQSPPPPQDEEMDKNMVTRAPPLCRCLKWWKVFAVFGLLCGFSYIFYLFSEAVLACHDRRRSLHDNHGGGGGGEEEAQTKKLMVPTSENGTEPTTPPSVGEERPKWLSHLNRFALTFLILATLLLSFGFVFLGSRQMELVPDGKGASESWPPFIVYVGSICHLILVVGTYFLIIL